MKALLERFCAVAERLEDRLAAIEAMLARDRRRFARRLTSERGRVFVGHTGSSFDCTISDISETGAKLTFGGPVALADQFTLLFIDSAMTVPVVKAWQRMTAVGVEFVGDVKDVGPKA